MPTVNRIVMLGTGDFALPTFVALCDAGFDVAALITQPDRPQGRRQTIVPAAIKVAAQERGILVAQPESINASDGVSLLQSLEPDLLVTAAYGQILSADALSVARQGSINLHGSILPAYRGAAPVARAIQDGATETGVTVILMSPRVDAGGMLAFARTPIGPDETAGEVEDRLARLGAPLVLQVIESLRQGTARVIPQDRSRVTRAPKLSKDDGKIDWSKPAIVIHNLVRAMQPWPGCTTHWQSSAPGKAPLRLIVRRTSVAAGTGSPGEILGAGDGRIVVAAGEGAVELLDVQAEGKRPMPIDDFLRGNRLQPGDRLV